MGPRGAAPAADRIHLRPAGPEDEPAIARLRGVSDEQHAEMLPDYFRIPVAPRPVPRGSSTEVVLVATLAETVVGYLVLHLAMTPPDPSLRPGPRARVDALVVDPAVRRRGVGRRLMEEARRSAAAFGATDLVLTVWANNDAAAAFYAALGLRPLASVLRWELAPPARRRPRTSTHSRRGP